MRSVTILGATGSIGRSTADVILDNPDQLRVEAVVAGRDAPALAAAARRLGARFAAVADPAGLAELKENLAGSGIEAGAGEGAVLEAADRPADVVVAGISGTAGLVATYAALRGGRAIALANKESLVCAGETFMRRAREVGAAVLPMDSEHNALHQALAAGDVADVTRLTITASGGPFRTWSRERIAAASAEEAGRHPVWSMGSKINIDSATLMNKGLELIEAHYLFGVAAERIGAVVHPQSIVHGLVQWRDGAVTAGLAVPDMRIPIAHCLKADRRLDLPRHGLDLAAIGQLSFEAPDLDRFPCLRLAQDALRFGGGMPAVLNAANEVAVAAFMAGQIRVYDIAAMVERTCESMASRVGSAPATVNEALTIDAESRRMASRHQLDLA